MSRYASVWWMLSVWLAPVVALGQGAVDEKSLREYLSKERTTVEESLQEMKRHDLDIIPARTVRWATDPPHPRRSSLLRRAPLRCAHLSSPLTTSLD